MFFQHELQTKKDKNTEKDDSINNDEDKTPQWIELYKKGEEEKAEEYLIQKLNRTEKRNRRARLYNDLGYIRFGEKLKKGPVARRNLDTAVDLHYSSIQVTLLNLACLDLDEEKYEDCIKKIQAALFLSHSPSEIEAAYLRLRLPKSHVGLVFKVKREMSPANIIEAAYINLAYAVLKNDGYNEAHKVLKEASDLFPSSIQLKHALARLYLSQKKANIALPIYAEIEESSLLDRGIKLEIQFFQRRFSKIRRKKSKIKKRRPRK